MNSNMPSVRSGRLGLVSYGLGLVFRVWARNSRLRVARTNLIADSDSTANLGHIGFFRVGSDISVSSFGLRYFCTVRVARVVPDPNGLEPVTKSTNTHFNPEKVYMTQNLP